MCYINLPVLAAPIMHPRRKKEKGKTEKPDREGKKHTKKNQQRSRSIYLLCCFPKCKLLEISALIRVCRSEDKPLSTIKLALAKRMGHELIAFPRGFRLSRVVSVWVAYLT